MSSIHTSKRRNWLQLGTKVWRVQKGFPAEGHIALGPATITAVIMRENRETYFLTWERAVSPFTPANRRIEVLDEQSGDDFYPSQEAAQAEADERHNAALRSQMRC